MNQYVELFIKQIVHDSVKSTSVSSQVSSPGNQQLEQLMLY